MKQQPMTTTVNADEKHRVISVVVEHADWQSFSRAVGPMATKEFKAWVRQHIVFGSLTKQGASLGYHDVRDTKGRCLSVFRFSY